MNLKILRSSAIAAVFVAVIASLGLLAARAGTGSDRVVRLPRCGPQRTDATTAPTHPYEETAPVLATAGRSIDGSRDTKLSPGDSPARARRSPRSTASAWWGTLAELAAPGHAPPLQLAIASQLPFDPTQAPADGRAPPAS